MRSEKSEPQVQIRDQDPPKRSEDAMTEKPGKNGGPWRI
jgi:hypothetical protein